MELRAKGRAEGPVARRARLLLAEAVEDLEERLRLLPGGLGAEAVRSVDVDPHLAGMASTVSTVRRVVSSAVASIVSRE